jgi:hypothetical protein
MDGSSSTPIEQGSPAPNHETTSASRWSYDQLKGVLRNAVLDFKELSLDELPSEIDFGTFARELDKMAVLQTQSLGDPREFSRLVGVEEREPHSLVFGNLRRSPNEFTAAPVDYLKDFLPGTLETLGGAAAHLHSHPIPVVFSIHDLLVPQYVDGMFPLIGVGSVSGVTIPGVIMFGLRSSETERITKDELESISQNSITERKSVIARRALEAQSQLLGQQMRIFAGSEEGARRFSELQDEIARREAERAHLALYFAPLGETVAKRCDLSKSLLSQLPVVA